MATYDSFLRKIYYDPSNEGSFSSAEKLYHAAKAKGIKISLKKVKEWLSGEITFTLHKQARRRWKRNPIVVEAVDEQWQTDLTFLRDFKEENDGHQYVLTVIDCLSRYAWGVPLKTKRPTEIVSAFKSIFKDRKPIKLQFDQGKEFLNQTFTSFQKNNEVHYFTANNPDIKCSMVERFNKILKNKMFKYFTATGKRNWTHVLPQFLHSHNNSINRITKFRPSAVSPHNQDLVFRNVYGVPSLYEYYKRLLSKKSTFSPGDKVRIKYQLKSMDRGFYPLWTDEVYEIESNIKGPKEMFRLKDKPNRRYYGEELQRVIPVIYRIEKVLKRRRRKGRVEYLVKWLNYPTSANQWIPAKNLTTISMMPETSETQPV